MWNSKLQAALDELERLHDTVREYKIRNGKLPNANCDAGRAANSLQEFQEQLNKLEISRLLER
jgi:hypothetical protein